LPWASIVVLSNRILAGSGGEVMSTIAMMA
jgi:hypothetical protein